MRQKKVKLSALLLLGLGLTGLEAQTMHVKQTSGTQTSYLLSNIHNLNFSPGNITVAKTVGIPDTYALSDIRYLKFQDLTTAIASVDKQGAIQLYPNPVADVLNIQLTNEGNQLCIIELLTIDGRLVYKEKQNPHENVIQVNVSLLAQGIYFCKVCKGTTTTTTKFIKQ